MATRSKNTEGNLFKGLLSWLCMTLCFTAFFSVIVGLITVAVSLSQAGLQGDLARLYNRLLQLDLKGFTELLAGFYPVTIGLVLLLAAFVLTFAFRQDRKVFEARLAGLLGRIWVEIKAAVIAFAVPCTVVLIWDRPYAPYPLLSLAVGVYIPVVILYFLCLDIGHNRRFFSHNIIHSLLTHLNDYKNLPTFEKRSLRRVYSCVAVICAILLGEAVFAIGMNDALFAYPLFSLGIFAVLTAAVLGVILWYIVALKQDLTDWNTLMDQIAEMYGGNLNAVNHVPPTSNLYHCAMELNSIRTGIERAVEEGTKADRTKVELITNVSHDIKTPLTSIISYIELLKKEPDLPPQAMDYVNTISGKAERLSHIVQDVFEVSKAATGNITLDMEELDLCKLLQQTFAEMEETMNAAPLTWRVEIPDTPILVCTDGQRMYRVFQNLVRNCTQYSLEGSRVYIQLTAQDGVAQVTVRNTSKTEITMSSEDLTARFIRGDQNRTTEGSGLGLSIAKSFTEACGGRFDLHTDGDLFLVTVQLPQVLKPQLELPGALPPVGEAPAPEAAPELVLPEENEQ